MMNRTIKTLLTLNLAVLCGVFLFRTDASRSVAAQSAKAPAAADNQELTRLHDEDQSDREPKNGKGIDWKAVVPRDEARLKRVKELYSQNLLHTGADYFHAALILQHSSEADDYILAHELCIVSIAKGDGTTAQAAKWLAAASEDRFLMTIKRPQRFATQYVPDGKHGYKLYDVGQGVTDDLRQALNVPSLEKAKAQEASMK